jgi:UDP-N-acetylglucosamine 2-epimerase (non-hydrolysing)
MTRVRSLLVAGARPNFMKVAPVYRALSRRARFDASIVHTGQHYDKRLSDTFFEELGLPAPCAELGVGSGRHGAQTGRVLEAFEALLWKEQPHLVLVVGDVNSTLGCALAAAKTWFADGRRPLIAHVEAGLRSFDRSMPEEVNRVLTDAVADVLFTTEAGARENLLREGISDERIHFVGNVMIDSLVTVLPRLDGHDVCGRLGVEKKRYALVTVHRPSNVDDRAALEQLIELLAAIEEFYPVVLPLHPRTAARAREFGLEGRLARLAAVTGPLPYTDFLALMKEAAVVLTDSGGIQEETTFLGVPCLTLRANTERPVTVAVGTNEVVGLDSARVVDAVRRVSAGRWKSGACPPLWDGHAAERIADVLEQRPR